MMTLIDRFMQGLTTLEEEDRIASYMRQGEVPRRLEAYREMFGYFDRGMPKGQYLADTEPRPKAKRRRLWPAAASVAAAVAAAVVLTWPAAETNNGLQQHQPTASVTPAAPAACTANDSAQQLVADSLKAAPAKRRTIRRTPKKHRYHVAPPEVLLAKAGNGNCATADASCMDGDVAGRPYNDASHPCHDDQMARRGEMLANQAIAQVVRQQQMDAAYMNLINAVQENSMQNQMAEMGEQWDIIYEDVKEY